MATIPPDTHRSAKFLRFRVVVCLVITVPPREIELRCCSVLYVADHGRSQTKMIKILFIFPDCDSSFPCLENHVPCSSGHYLVPIESVDLVKLSIIQHLFVSYRSSRPTMDVPPSRKLQDFQPSTLREDSGHRVCAICTTMDDYVIFGKSIDDSFDSFRFIEISCSADEDSHSLSSISVKLLNSTSVKPNIRASP